VQKIRSRLLKISLSLLTFLCLVTAAPVSAQSIGAFFDKTAESCQATALPMTVDTLFVLALLRGPSSNGITSAEFRVEGMPSAWLAIAVPATEALTIGDPLGNGCDIVFPICQIGSDRLVLLYSILYITSSEPVENVTLRIDSRSPPTEYNFPCPSVTLCDQPAFTRICCRGGEAFINSNRTCTVDVESKSWSQIKSLYNR